MAKPKMSPENEEGIPDLTAGLGEPSKETGAAGKLAGFTASLPLIGHLGDITLTLALRWLLWMLAVLLCLGGLVAGLAGMGIGYVAVGSISASVSGPLDASSTALSDASNSISNYALVGANISNATASMSGGLRNLSTGLTGASATLEGLTSIPIIGSQLSGLATAAGQIRQSSSGLNAAADQLDASGTAVAGATTTLYAVSSDLAQIGTSLQNAKKLAQTGLFYLQLAVLAAGAAVELLLGGTLCLALAYGPPKK